MFRPIGSSKGIALVTTLMLMTLALGVVAAILTLTVQGVKMTGLERRYASNLDAARGGAEYVLKMLESGEATLPAGNVAGAAFPSGSPACFEQKTNNATPPSSCTVSAAAWSGCSWNSCPYENPLSTDPTVNPDVTLTLSSHRVFVKIIDTRYAVDEEGKELLYYTVNTKSVVPGTQERTEISVLYRVEP